MSLALSSVLDEKLTVVQPGAVVVVAVVGIAFLMGRRKGKKGRTIVEVRRV